MAVQDSQNPSHSGARLSPGDAAFARLRQRESLKAREEPETPRIVSAILETECVGPPVMPPDLTPPANPVAAPIPVALGESPAPDAVMLLPPPADSSPADPASVPPVVDKAPAAEPVDRVLAVAAALGIEVAPSAPASPVPAEPPPAPVIQTAPSGDAAAARLEAALLDQLKSLEETLVEDVPLAPLQIPRAEPLRPPKVAAAPPEIVGPPGRSVFAPDPVRQRTYVDLRSPAPAPERAASDDSPWLKYLDAPPRRTGGGRERLPRPATTRPAAWPSPAVARDRKAEVEERRRGIRAMTAAAVLGLGVGLGLLVLIRPFTDSGASTTAAPAPGPEAPVLAAAPPSAAPERIAASGTGSGNPVNQALATLLADPPASGATAGQPAVISEGGAALAAASPAAVAAAEQPVVIRPPPGEAQRVVRVPDFDAAQPGPLGYVPAIPSYDPVGQSLFREEARLEPQAETGAPVAATAPAAAAREAAPPDIEPGRAIINGFVNLRANPDNAAPVVAILAEGLSVKVIACDYWCEVEAGGKRGFIYKKFVSR